MTSPVRLSSERMKTLPQGGCSLKRQRRPAFLVPVILWSGQCHWRGHWGSTHAGQAIILAGEKEGIEVEVAIWRGNMEQS